ncbi:transketolase [Anabaena cylindrica FACHB-243]|uniref:Transketolase n=1 Tax=Anabaena cylindrica (strain ATCC 27899 / PCC 7122) TaxID=272123 RepID=K9ZBQ5_ANACC|nr:MULTISPECIES: transketolase [Anabaena]AFZ56633.1 Transketolase [Anabaena cylindrica PCC 7122]MBD2416195.1 transketolase [Anabaena cylindrica FACHB-243]MBY5284787.1 transketolase [Anabaena sp. CCAP 1446/1C]MBY5309119.1 transketolase [Anabaena sp. CCAP 1446/1C]MCM2408926.1 transketolase [Anabaena sp. CCAP 1446/1C]
MTTQEQLNQWQELAQQLRIDSIRATTVAGSGHPTSSMSSADLMAVLLSKYLHYDFDHPDNPNNDRFILSKGHAAPLLYSMYKAAGVISDQELLSLRQLGSRLEGHPTPVFPWVDVATGSLGQGLPIGVGVALAGKYLDQLPYNIWVLLGDSETAEGSIWEAFDHASHYSLDNLIAIIDVNRLGQRGQTELGWNTQAYANRAKAFGWQAIEIDGHNLTEIDQAFSAAVAVNDRPTVIIAKTKKGKGVKTLEDIGGWHGKALKAEQEQQAIAELGGERHITIAVDKPESQSQPAVLGVPQPLQLPTYKKDQKVATRRAYGDALLALGTSQPDVIVLDAEVSNSTYAEDFAEAFPERYFEMYIAEQQMIAAAVGLQVRKYKPFASTFAAFLTRAYDFVRMAAVSRANIKLVGSHAGVSIGQDGASQMGLEDLAAFRAVWNSTVLYPSDANQTAKLVAQMSDAYGKQSDRTGIVYLRTTRESTPVIYSSEEIFPIGGSKTLHRSHEDQATVIGAGITLHEALKAYERLKNEGIKVRVIDAYSVKPIDVQTLRQAAKDTNGNLIVVEDHWLEGGLGDAVLDAFAGNSSTHPYKGSQLQIIKLAVRDMPTSGTPEELLHAAKIDADAIVETVKLQVRQLVGVS